MTEIRTIVPAELDDWVKSRLADGGYPDPGEYLLDLIRRDQLGLVAEPEEDSPEQIAWLRERIAEGLASGVSKEDPFEFLDRLIAKHRPSHG